MSRIVRFDSKIIGGKLVKVPVYETNFNTFRPSITRQMPNEFNKAAGRSSLGLYGASQSFTGSHNTLARYDDYGKILNFRTTPREQALAPFTANSDVSRNQRIEAQNNRARVLSQLYRSELSPEPEHGKHIARPISSDPLAADVASALVPCSRAVVLRMIGKMQRLDPGGTGTIYSEDVINILNMHDVNLDIRAREELLGRYQTMDGKIHYKDFWQYISDCHLRRDSLKRKRIGRIEEKGGTMAKSDASVIIDEGTLNSMKQQDSVVSSVGVELRKAIEHELKDNARKLQVPLDLRPLKNSLRNCDRGNTGLMGINEFKVLSQHYLPISTALMERLLSHFDSNNSGWIKYQELLDVLEEENPIFLPQLSSRITKSTTQGIFASPRREVGTTSNPLQRRDTFVVAKANDKDKCSPGDIKSQHSTPRKTWQKTRGKQQFNDKAGTEEQKPHLNRKKWELSRPVTDLNAVHEQQRYLRTEESDAEEVTILLNGKEHVLYPSDNLDSYQVKDSMPKKHPKLKWIYGYSGSDSRNNICCLASGEVAYTAGIFVVVWDTSTESQKHYTEHTAKITSIALHPDGVTIASGQADSLDEDRSAKALVRIWLASSLATLAVIGENVFANSIVGMAFSLKFNVDRGVYLLVADDDKDSTLTVWNWNNKSLVSKAKVPAAVVFGIVCSPVANEFVMYGREYIALWKINDDQKLIFEKLRFAEKPVPKFITSVIYRASGDLIAGDSSGLVHIWNKGSRKPDQMIRNAHEGPVSSLCLMDDLLLTAGARDLRVHAWNDQLKPMGIDIPIHKSYLGCQCLAMINGALYIGTSSNAILRTKIGNDSLSLSGSRELFTALSEGHADSIVGIVCHPFERRFISAAANGSIHSYSTFNNLVNWKTSVQGNASGLTIHPSGNVVLVSCFDGSIHFLDGNTGQFITKVKATNSGIHALEFSPDTSQLAAGTHEGKVFIFKYDKKEHELDPIGIGKGLSTPVHAIDWSADNKYIRAQSSAAEVVSWHFPDMIAKSQFETRNTRWLSFNCSLDYMVAGIWTESKFSNPEAAYAVAVSRQQEIASRGDQQGKIRIYNFPTFRRKMPYHEEQGSSNTIKFLRFSPDGESLFAVATEEGLIGEWHVL